MPRAKSTSSGPKPPPRAAVAAIIRRYLKPDQNILWAREMSTFYTIWKRYPSQAFWERHTLPFKLNHMTWFTSIEGAATLASDYAVFHYTPEVEVAAPVQLDPLPVDTPDRPAYHAATPPPNTVAGFLKPKL